MWGESGFRSASESLDPHELASIDDWPDTMDIDSLVYENVTNPWLSQLERNEKDEEE